MHWSVTGATTVVIDGSPDEIDGLITVTPTETRDFMLVALRRMMSVVQRAITIEVIGFPPEGSPVLDYVAVAAVLETLRGKRIEQIGVEWPFHFRGDAGARECGEALWAPC